MTIVDGEPRSYGSGVASSLAVLTQENFLLIMRDKPALSASAAQDCATATSVSALPAASGGLSGELILGRARFIARLLLYMND
jgi:hypothetical protein